MHPLWVQGRRQEGAPGAFINLHVFRRENHFLQPLGEYPRPVCVSREAADLQQRTGYITGPHGVAHNNHRCLSAGMEAAPSFDLVIRLAPPRSQRHLPIHHYSLLGPTFSPNLAVFGNFFEILRLLQISSGECKLGYAKIACLIVSVPFVPLWGYR